MDVMHTRERESTATEVPAVEAEGLTRRFGDLHAVRDVSFSVPPGEIHALLGPNGAGKTTLLRLLTGLVAPTSGEIRILGRSVDGLGYRQYRKLFGFVPSGDRSFYLRISGLENLSFFGRLYGMRRRAATRRAWECIRDVGLEHAARKRVGLYSHGMQKRLSIARGLLTTPPILFIDEATHDLDPDGTLRIQELVSRMASRGTAVMWATQRLDEIRGFAQRVTVLDRGNVRFGGTVSELAAMYASGRYVLHLRDGSPDARPIIAVAVDALRPYASIEPSDEQGGEHFLVALRDGVVLGRALASLTASGIDIMSCREERSMIVDAFMHLTGGER
jgi:ABC-type multidrug transport system ATPase subunit